MRSHHERVMTAARLGATVAIDASVFGIRGAERRQGTMSEPDRTKLPIRRPPFQGVSNRTLAGSEPDWDLIGSPEPPAGAPNVLLVLIDDVGFGKPATFGGPIDTPNYTRMAEGGLRYNRFHVTALCSPTQAALLTGRNNHAVGFGSVGEFSSGFPPRGRGPATRRSSGARSSPPMRPSPPPAARSPCTSTTGRSARAAWTTPSRSGSPRRRAWTSAATTEGSLT